LDNNTSMFATVFCGILDTRTGEVEFANAGHNPPLVCSGGEHFKFLQLEKGFVLGPMEKFRFKPGKIKLGHGDCFFLYTDGVTEAMNPRKEFFTEERLRNTLEKAEVKNITEIVADLRKEIRDFVCEEPQSDDITMLIFRFN